MDYRKAFDEPIDQYHYPKSVEAQIREQVALAMPTFKLTPTDQQTDFHGVDYFYELNNCTPLAVRCRFNRPLYAPEADITFRHAELPRIALGSYAALDLVLWFRRGQVVAGKAFDIPTLNKYARPPLVEREITWNPPRKPGDVTGFITVTIDETRKCRALLMEGDGRHYHKSWDGAYARIQRIIAELSKRKKDAFF